MADLGTDLDGVTDLTEELGEVSGRMGLAQALARRVITPRASLVDDPNYGFDVTDYLDDDVTASDLKQCAGGVDAEFRKDERVLDSTTTVTVNAGVMRIEALIVDSAGPFSLVLAVSAVTVDVLKVAP